MSIPEKGLLKILGKIGSTAFFYTEQLLRILLILMLLGISIWATRCIYEFYTFLTNSDGVTWWAIYFPLPLGFASLYINPLLTPLAFFVSYIGIKALLKDVLVKRNTL